MNVVEKKQDGSQVSYTIKKEMVDFIKKSWAESCMILSGIL